MIDAHCHIHEADFPFEIGEVLSQARERGVERMITVGTSVRDSRVAAEFAADHAEVWALVGIHPGEVIDGGVSDIEEIIRGCSKVVGLGDMGLDYHYEEAANDREVQKRLLREFLELAVKMDMPVSFHVREAFADFWPILDEFEGKVRGVLHSFTGTREEMEEGLRRGFYIGVNGIVTFAESVREVVRECPLERVILETDAPWLAPVPYRGEQNQPGNLRAVGEFLAKLYGVSLEEVERVTTENVMKIFWGRE